MRIYTMSTKKLHPCIRCHNFGKRRRILTKLYANTETLNCKQVTKFQQNRSTSATATASLVRSLKSISVHYRHRRDWLSIVRPCEWQDVNTPKVCVQNVHRVLERKLEDVVATAWPLHRWPPGGRKCSHSSIRCDFSWSTSRIWLRYTRSCSFPQIW